MKRIAVLLIVGAFCSSVMAAAKDYHDQDLKGQNFSGKALDGSNFSDAILTSTIFSNASLRKAIFKDATIQYTWFQHADLSGADLTGALGEADFNGATLSDANLEGLSISGSLGDCKCRGTNFKKAKIAASIFRSDFRAANFSGANLRGSTIDTRGVVQWKGAIYDQDTVFPPTFDPEAAKMVLIKSAAPEPLKDPKAANVPPAVSAPPSPSSPSPSAATPPTAAHRAFRTGWNGAFCRVRTELEKFSRGTGFQPVLHVGRHGLKTRATNKFSS